MIPRNNEIHFFDLDGTLWNINSKVWIIDKEKPTKALLKLNSFEMNKIQNGFYVHDELKIEYNDKEYFISKELFDKLNKKKNLPIERLGVSFIEFYNDKYINNSDIKFLIDNIKHVDKSKPICLLTGRSNRKKHVKVLNLLRLKLKELGLNLFKIYFVSDSLQNKHNETISLNKTHILLEHMIGIKIEDNKFVSLKQDWYTKVNFYDDEKMNIDYANDVQTIFNRVMKNTDDDVFKIVNERIDKYDITLVTNLITNNEHNRFKTTKTVLQKPMNFPIKINEKIKRFKNF